MSFVLRIGLVASLIFQAADTQARTGGVKAKVEVTLPRLLVVKSDAELHDLCGVRQRIDACTGFVAYQLLTSCSRSDNEWFMTAAARFTPYIILRRRNAMTHEMIHIRDVEKSLVDLMMQLQQTAFASRSLCEAAGARTQADLPRLMNDFARASNQKHHPSRGRERKRRSALSH